MAVSAVLGVVAGCGTPGSESDAVGFGLPSLPVDGTVPGERTDLHGTLRIESNGCLVVETADGQRRWVVWPSGAREVEGGVQLDGSLTVGAGDVLDAVGATVELAALPDGEVRDSYFGAFGRFCGAERTGVVVLDRVVGSG